MRIQNTEKLKVLFVSALLVLIKYAVSYFFNYEEDLFFKIIRLADSDFETYAMIVESLSRLDLKTNWSSALISKNIIGFPFLALIWHSILFNISNYYSFIILEPVFYFLIIFLIFKIFFFIQDSYKIAFLSTILLLLFIEILTFLSNLNTLSFEVTNFFYVLLLPLAEFYGQRFPHPLVTSVYLLAFIFIVAKINRSNNLLIKPKYVYLIGLISIFLINSFFFHFVKASIFIFIFSIFRYKKKFFRMLRVNLLSIFIYCLFLLVGFAILLIQLNFAGDDYSSRLGVYNIDLNDKLIILKVLLKKLYQVEIILLIFLSSIARYNYKRLGIIGNDIFKYDILFIFFISCLLSPYIFIILTTTSIYLYYFWSAVKFSGFLFLFAITIKIFFNFKLKLNIKFLSSLFLTILILLNLYNNILKQKDFDYSKINDRNDIQKFLENEKYIDSKIVLLSDDYSIMHLWLKLKNKHLIMTHGFVSSYSDELLENMKFNNLKMMNVSLLSFKNLLFENENTQTNRNNFATTFGYKYSVNSIRHNKPIQNEYSPKLQQRILKISPLVQWHQFFSNSEKERLIEKYRNFKLNKQLIPQLLILKTSSLNELSRDNLIALNYREIFSNQTFIIIKLMN
tara:strand:+ start:1890 stop:3761 length:1872 start_codon:yes stop_codon:yes gene_type:complete